jgi:hypothetical protein
MAPPIAAPPAAAPVFASRAAAPVRARPAAAPAPAAPPPPRPQPEVGISEAAVEPAAPAVASGGGQSTSDLRASWTRLIGVINQTDKGTAAMLRSCEVIGLDGQTVRLATSKFVNDKINADQAARQLIETRFGEVLGFACIVKFEEKGQSRRSARSGDIPEGGLVAAALDLGGEIVD